MSKYAHHKDTLIILEDIKNRLVQFQDANREYQKSNPELVLAQNNALRSAQLIVQQAIDTGGVYRGNIRASDALLDYNVTPSVDETLRQ